MLSLTLYASSDSDSPILSGQIMDPPAIDVTDRPSIPATHQTRPTVPEEQGHVAQQTTHLEMMAPEYNHSIPGYTQRV